MSTIKSIKCTNCAAPLDLLGGGRVESITCSYCKSLLDLNDNYKVLSNFKNVRKLHKLPFEIGMKGTLEGVNYTIIGRVTYADTSYTLSQWTDFLLFSPLYGYAYLTYEEGHLIYSKRNRTFPNITWSQLSQQASVGISGRTYTPFDAYDARVVYVEGELTWIAKRNDKTSFVDLSNPPYGISAEKTKNEIEYYEAKYLNSSLVYKAFNIQEENIADSFHALKPFERPFLKSLSLISYWVLFIIALLTLTINIDGSGKVIKNIFAENTKIQNIDFQLSSTKYLLDLELSAASAKALNNFNLQIHKDKKIIFSLTPSAAYIFHEDSNSIKKKLHPWERQSKKVRISLNLEATGIYHLNIKPIDPNFASTISVRINEKSSRLNYLGWFFLLTLLLWSIYKYFKWRYNKARTNEQGILHNTYNDNGSWDNTWGSNVINNIYWAILAIAILVSIDAFG